MRALGLPYDDPLANGYGRNPFASLVAGAGGFTAAPAGLAMGCFGWADPTHATVSNAYTAGFLLGFVLPTFNGWNWQRVQPGCAGSPALIRGGFPVVLARLGDFYARFPAGATAGSAVFADPLYGMPTCVPTGNIATPWTCMTSCGPNQRARISTAAIPFFN